VNFAGQLTRFIQRQKSMAPALPLFVAVLSQYSDDELLAFDKAYAASKIALKDEHALSEQIKHQRLDMEITE
jgi:hypothetical protein